MTAVKVPLSRDHVKPNRNHVRPVNKLPLAGFFVVSLAIKPRANSVPLYALIALCPGAAKATRTTVWNGCPGVGGNIFSLGEWSARASFWELKLGNCILETRYYQSKGDFMTRNEFLHLLKSSEIVRRVSMSTISGSLLYIMQQVAEDNEQNSSRVSGPIRQSSISVSFGSSSVYVGLLIWWQWNMNESNQVETVACGAPYMRIQSSSELSSGCLLHGKRWGLAS